MSFYNKLSALVNVRKATNAAFTTVLILFVTQIEQGNYAGVDAILKYMIALLIYIFLIPLMYVFQKWIANKANVKISIEDDPQPTKT